MCDFEGLDVGDGEPSRLKTEGTDLDSNPGESSGIAEDSSRVGCEGVVVDTSGGVEDSSGVAEDRQGVEMALETERSSPSGASSPGPSRDVHRPHSTSSPASSPPLCPTSSISSSPPLSRFEPETAHGDTSGPPPPPPPPPPPLLPHDPPPTFFPRLPHPSPSASDSSSASSYYAGSPPLFHIPYHHLSPFSAPCPPPPSIVAPQAILAAGVALGGLALGGTPPSMDATTVCGWPPEILTASPARPLPHHPNTTSPLLAPHPHSASPLLPHHHHQPHPLLRLRPSEEALSTNPRAAIRHPLVVAQPAPPTPLPFSVDNILRPAFGLRAVLEEEERGRRRLLLGGKERAPSPPPTLPPLPPLPAAPKKKRKAPEVQPPTRDLPPTAAPEVGGQSKQTATAATASSGGLEASSPAKAEESKEPKLPNPENGAGKEPMLWPAWVYCTRYSDRPSSGPRSRRVKRKERAKPGDGAASAEEKRPRTAFSAEQLSRLKQEFAESRYLTEKRRQTLARDLRLNESQIKIWFQNKRAKIKKASGQKGGLALQLMAQGLYNHSTVPVEEDEEEEAAAAAAAAAAAEEEKRRQAAAAAMGMPPVMVGGGPGAVPLDTRPPPLLVER